MAVRSVGLVLVIAAQGLAVTDVAAGTCTPPELLILADASATMSATTPGGGSDSKWVFASSAIESVATANASSVHYGLAVYPVDAACDQLRQRLDQSPFVAPAASSSADIRAAMSGLTPAGQSPLLASLLLARDYVQANPSTGKRALVVVTDGGDTCATGSEDDLLRALGEAAASLRSLGVVSHVLAIGDDIDRMQLNTVAVRGGTPTGDPAQCLDPLGVANCYDWVFSEAGFQTALSSITLRVTAEACNGLDDDCDGKTDEGFGIFEDDDAGRDVRPCTGTLGVCAMTIGKRQCVTADMAMCSVDPGGTEDVSTEETCDGTDEDCDGDIDNGVSCVVDGGTARVDAARADAAGWPGAVDAGPGNGADGGAGCGCRATATVPRGPALFALLLWLAAWRRSLRGSRSRRRTASPP